MWRRIRKGRRKAREIKRVICQERRMEGYVKDREERSRQGLEETEKKG